MELPIETVLAEMFNEKKYVPAALGNVQNIRVGYKVSLTGKVWACAEEGALEFDFGNENEKPVTVAYLPRIGISEIELLKLCRTLSDGQLETRIYGEVDMDQDYKDIKLIRLHKIEFERDGRKQEIPGPDLLENIMASFPGIDDCITFQKYEKRLAKVLKNLEHGPEWEAALNAKAALAFYEVFSEFSYKMAEKLSYEAPKVILIESDRTKKEVQPGL